MQHNSSFHGAAHPQVETPSEKRPFSGRTIAFTLMGTMLVTFIATLDQTAVSTALPRVVADLQGFDQITWITTIYLLTSTVTIPIYGKLSDLLGRKSIFLVSISIFLVGSALSGTARSMLQLIIFRAIQGIGAGGLQPIATAVVGDLFPPRERGRWIGITSSSYALASIVGPLAGGLLTDAISWRWIFYINLPLGLIALFVLIFLMPSFHTPGKRIIIDYIGSLLIVLATLFLLLGCSWVGKNFSWLSWQSFGLFGSSLVLLLVLIIYSLRQEQLGREPVLEPSMFKNVRIFSISLLASMFISIALLGSVYFLPTFLQSVIGFSATSSGLTLMPLSLASIAGAVLVGQLIAATGRYKWIALSGAALLIMGFLLLLHLNIHSTSLDVIIAILILGPGVGSGLSLYTITAQNSMPGKIGQATSAVVFFRQMGQSIGLAAMGTVVTASYISAFYRAIPGAIRSTVPLQMLKVFEDPSVLLSPNVITSIQTGFEGQATFNVLLNAVKLGLTESIHDAILLSLGLTIFTFILVCFLKEIPLRSYNR